jgi:hypothetical protein
MTPRARLDAIRARTRKWSGPVQAVMQRRWPAIAKLAVGPPDSIFNVYPKLFAGAYPPIDARRLERFSLACRHIAGAIVLSDRVIDNEASRETVAGVVLRLHALNFESYAAFADLFGRDMPIWNALRSNLAEFCLAMSLESQFVGGLRSFSMLDDAEAERIARMKTGLARIAVQGLGALSGVTEAEEALVRSVDAYNVARQIVDDVLDWKEDFRCRRPSTVMARLHRFLPAHGAAPESADLLRAGRVLYYDGHASALLDRAVDLVSSSIREPVFESVPVWSMVMDDLRDGAGQLRRDLQAIADRNVAALAV